jgi:CzcA family heavy metal efflux pump
MMAWLVRTSLELRFAVMAFAAVLMVVGVRVASQIPLDVFPEFAPPLVEIQTEAQGLSTDEVESFITVPLEAALTATPWLKTLRSKSVQGLSSVVLLFEEGTDLMRARQLVSERVAVEAPRLPSLARTPVILSPLSSLSRVLKIGISSTKLSQIDLTELARWTIRPKLMSVPGVANVAIWGQRDRQFQVLVDPDRLRARGVTLDAVVRAAGDAAALASGGFLESPTQRLAVRQSPFIREPDDLARTLVEFRSSGPPRTDLANPNVAFSPAAGVPVRLGDIARIEVSHPPPIGDGLVNDKTGLLLIVEKQPWGNTLEVTRRVEKALDVFRPQLADVHIDATIFRPATFIERSISNLGKAMAIGCVLVVLVLMLFLADWRTALISVTAIPLSVSTAVTILYLRGGTLDTMVLAGLVIALGEVVDDAIIDVENIARRLRLERDSANPSSPLRIVLEASLEVRSAVVFASGVVVLVFLPVFFLDGLAGSFFRPLAHAYVLAIGASLLVALTVTPAMSLLLLSSEAERPEPWLSRVSKARYGTLLQGMIFRPRLAVLILVVCFAGSGLLVLRLGEEFLPRFKETDFLMHWLTKPGTSLAESTRISAIAASNLLKVPGVRNLGAHIGRAEVADEVVGPNFTELWISIDPSLDYDKTVSNIQHVVDEYPGLVRDLLTYLTERIKEVLTGASAALVVRTFGPDLGELRARAQEIKGALQTVRGLKDLKVESQVLVPQVDVRIKPDAAARYGLTPGQVRRAVSTLVRGTKAGEIYQDQKIYEVTVWGEPHLRTDVSALRRLPIDNGLGTWVPLSAVADVAIVAAPNEIKREKGSRRIDVTCNVLPGYDLGAIAREVSTAARTVKLGREYHAELLGEYEARQRSQRRLFELAGLAVLGIVLLLQIDLESLRLVGLVLVSLPFSLVGGVVGAFLAGGTLSLGSLVGFVTVLGIAGRNGIMLISHYRHLEEVEGEPFGEHLVIRGAQERLVPILMTAACAGLGLVPLLISGPVPGHEIEYPMAWVILGGLISSTALNVILMPALYFAVGRGHSVAGQTGSARSAAY